MPTHSRGAIVDSANVGIYHLIGKCVRHAFLCGHDPETGRDHEHRKGWVGERIELLMSVFAIDLCVFAVMSNHFHLAVRIRPDVAAKWTPEEVARRYLVLHSLRGVPIEDQIAAILATEGRVEELRRRLSCLSTLMAEICEPIARRANKEEGRGGRFWNGRFFSQRLLDANAVLACAIYIDLNPIRAGKAVTPEASMNTSAFVRIEAMMAEAAASPATGTGPPPPDADGFLCPMPIGGDEPAKAGRNAGRRLGNEGFLPIDLKDYLCLLDWYGRQVRPDKPCAMPANIPPILERLGYTEESWKAALDGFATRRYGAFVGPLELVRAMAEAAGKRWTKGMTACHTAFGAKAQPAA